MTINKFNYEAFALDYLEGNLSLEMAEEMELFLKTHPAIESELSGMMEFVTLEADNAIIYEQKDSLLKPERVIWIQKRWIRPLLAAASVALLLMTYIMGYQAGVNNGTEQVIVENEDSNNSTKERKVAVNEIESLAEVEPIEKNKVAEISPIIIKESIVTNKNEIAPIITQPIERPSIGKEKTIITDTETRNYLTEKIPVLTTNPLPLPPNKTDVAQMEQMMTSVLTTLAATNLMHIQISSTSTNTNDLKQVLAADLPLDKEKLAQQLKRKRNFKDFLGKFPVNNLKEALIPSYYREEATGQ